MFNMLAPGGTMLVANFTPHSAGRYFMEAFMDWRLIYRDEFQMKALTQEIAPQEVASLHTSVDLFGNIAYLEIKKLS